MIFPYFPPIGAQILLGLPESPGSHGNQTNAWVDMGRFPERFPANTKADISTERFPERKGPRDLMETLERSPEA